jgi:hypothetical protein
MEEPARPRNSAERSEAQQASAGRRLVPLLAVAAFALIAAVLYDLAPLKYNREAAWNRATRVVYLGQPWHDAEKALGRAGFRLFPETVNPEWTRVCIRAPFLYEVYVPMRRWLSPGWQNWTSIVGSVRHSTGTVNRLQELRLTYTVF